MIKGSILDNQLSRWIAQPVLKPWLSRFHQYEARPLNFAKNDDEIISLKEHPSIAIVTPSYNHALFIRSTIESVLSQNYPRLNYVVQDGNSTDGTQKILASYGCGLQWLSAPDAGQADAINTGFQHVSGDIMGWLNSDDMLSPRTLNYVARFFQMNPEIDLIYGHRIVIDRDGHEIGRIVLPPHDSKALRHGDYVPQETMFWRRRVWQKTDGLDPTFQFAMDWDFLLRAQSLGFRFKRLPRFMGIFRFYPEQKSQAMVAIGEYESSKLRQRSKKSPYRPVDFRCGFWFYLFRQFIYQNLYRMGVLPY